MPADFGLKGLITLLNLVGRCRQDCLVRRFYRASADKQNGNR